MALQGENARQFHVNHDARLPIRVHFPLSNATTQMDLFLSFTARKSYNGIIFFSDIKAANIHGFTNLADLVSPFLVTASGVLLGMLIFG